MGSLLCGDLTQHMTGTVLQLLNFDFHLKEEVQKLPLFHGCRLRIVRDQYNTCTMVSFINTSCTFEELLYD